MAKSEILAPAGDEQSAYAAINSGADAIYLGLNSFSARSSAQNFDLDGLEKLISYAHDLGVKIYVAMNTVIKNGELEEFVNSAVKVHNIGADAIIIQDLFLGAYLKKTYPQMCLHLSTQAGICNAYGARLAKRLGYSRVILARETSLADVKEIAQIIETEVFVQGALCTCFSGQCYLSSFAGGNSGNRGRCKQPCRKRYSIDRKGVEEQAYRISLSDLSVGADVNAFVNAGVTSFKIEGRMRRPEYVAAAVKYYKKLLSGGVADSEFSALKRTYNRGNYTKGLAFGQDKSFISSAVQGHIGEYIGTVFVQNSKYLVRGAKGGNLGDGYKILRGGKEVCGATFDKNVKDGIIIKSSYRLKNGDKVFITTDKVLNEKLLSFKRVLKVEISARVVAGKPPVVYLNGEEYAANFAAQTAEGRPLDNQTLQNCFNKVDTYPFEVSYCDMQIAPNVFVPLSQLNAFRREVYSAHYNKLSKNGNKKIENVLPLPQILAGEKNDKKCVIAGDLNGVEADIGVLKPADYFAPLSGLCSQFKGQKYLYLPPYLRGSEIDRLKPVIKAFDGIYCGGNYALELAQELNIELFAGDGFNITNSLSLSQLNCEYVALSKELTISEAKGVANKNTFYLTAGDIQVMDLIYCPFGKTCASCDKREFYTLTDEQNRAFTLRRYQVEECRFQLYNCAPLISQNDFTGALYEFTCQPNPAHLSRVANNVHALKTIFKNYTKGHTENPVL